MIKLPKKILAIANLEADNQLALERAVAIAAASSAQVQLQAITYRPEYDDGLFHWQKERSVSERERRSKAVKSWLEDQANALAAEDATVAVKCAHPFDEAVLAVVAESAPDLVVFQPRDPKCRRLSRAEWRLIRQCPSPVWLARSGQRHERPKILVAVDPSHAHDKPASLDEQLVNAARSITQALGGDLHVIHALGTIPSVISVAQSPQEYEAGLRDARTKRIRALLPDDVDVKKNLHLPTAEAGDALQELCESQQIDLLAMGLLARSRLGEFLIGSTAREIVSRTTCDVLFVKPAAS